MPPVPQSLRFVVGNTYSKIAWQDAKRSRNGKHKKVHDVVIFVDVLQGNPDLIERVSFDLGSTFNPPSYLCHTPVAAKPASRGNQIVWRFATRQQIYGQITANIKIRGAGGSVLDISHTLELDPSSEQRAHRGNCSVFTETKEVKPLKPIKMPDSSKFGIELELTSATHLEPRTIAAWLQRKYKLLVDVKTDNYSSGRATSENWKLVHDSSIQCSSNFPNCNTFELVSPILESGYGLANVSKVLKACGNLEPQTGLKVNKTMGFHVHVDVSKFTHDQLRKICQQYIKYEDVMDSFMPPSRRTGSAESNRFFKSNRTSVAASVGSSSRAGPTNKACHDALERCHDIRTLALLMNRDNRYYKLNMENLVTRRQPTIEFRQHSATAQYDKVGAWVRFCVAFCYNSARLAAPTPFREGKSPQEKFDALFQYVIKDRALRDFYRKRRAALAQGEDDADGDGNCSSCCSDCSSGNLSSCPTGTGTGRIDYISTGQTKRRREV